jgi:hypothetical protein
MNHDAPIRTGDDAFMTLRAFSLIKHDMVAPGQGLLRTGHDAELLLAGDADFNPAHLGPVVLDVNPCHFDALQPGFVGGGAGQHAQSAVSATASFEFEHGFSRLLECFDSHLSDRCPAFLKVLVSVLPLVF